MEERPPPYPGKKPQPYSEQISPTRKQISDLDLAEFCHPHVLLVSTVNSINGLSTTLFHHWTGRSPTSSISIRTEIGLNSLQKVRNFQELGTFTLPTAIMSADIHEYLTLLIAESSTDLVDEIIPHIMAKLSSLAESQGLSVQFFSIPVLSNSSDNLLADGPILIWKWAKPASFYEQKTGFWELDVGKAIEDGEWMAGKDLMILMKGVPKETAEDLEGRRVKFVD